MQRVEYLLTKAGPRLIDCFVEADQIDILVTGPGMLFDRLDLLTNQSALNGCDASFYTKIAADLEGEIHCGLRPPSAVTISVEPHRVGLELSIRLGPTSMYQSLLWLRTRSGRTFRDLIETATAGRANVPLIAVFHAVRSSSHHEHHASAHKAIRERAATMADQAGH